LVAATFFFHLFLRHLLADNRVVDRKRKTLREKPLEAVGCFVDARKLGERVDICEKAL